MWTPGSTPGSITMNLGDPYHCSELQFPYVESGNINKTVPTSQIHISQSLACSKGSVAAACAYPFPPFSLWNKNVLASMFAFVTTSTQRQTATLRGSLVGRGDRYSWFQTWRSRHSPAFAHVSWVTTHPFHPFHLSEPHFTHMESGNNNAWTGCTPEFQWESSKMVVTIISVVLCYLQNTTGLFCLIQWEGEESMWQTAEGEVKGVEYPTDSWALCICSFSETAGSTV